MNREVVLVDGGGTNIASLRFAFERLGVFAELTSDPRRIRAATHVILPGVGAAGPGMAKLRKSRLVDVLRELTQPLLGVCLGMQLLYEHSEEGDTPCLGLLSGTIRKLSGVNLRVPHMGWNVVKKQTDDSILAGIGVEPYAYFVHSYAAPVSSDTIASCDYGGDFSAIVRRGDICGMQFHPERSAAMGARLLENFLEL
jgi:imidazole glycerol-phosphate synthase subunit HisH